MHVKDLDQCLAQSTSCLNVPSYHHIHQQSWLHLAAVCSGIGLLAQFLHLFLFRQMRTQWEGGHLQPKKELNWLAPYSWISQIPEPWGLTSCYLSSPVYDNLFWQLEMTNIEVICLKLNSYDVEKPELKAGSALNRSAAWLPKKLHLFWSRLKSLLGLLLLQSGF